MRAGAELVARHDAALRRYYRRRLGAAQYEDEAQRTWLAMIHGLDRFRGGSTVRTYLYAIAGNHVREARRRDRKRSLHDEPSVSLEDPRPSVVTMLARLQDEQRLRQAMQRLSPEHARLLELYYYERCPARLLGQRLGIPEETVRSRLRRAKLQLRAALEE